VSVWGRYEGATSLRVVRLHPTPHRHKANPRHPLALAWRRCVCGVSGVACLPPSTRQVPGTSRTSSPLDRFSGGRFQEGGRWRAPPSPHASRLLARVGTWKGSQRDAWRVAHQPSFHSPLTAGSVDCGMAKVDECAALPHLISNLPHREDSVLLRRLIRCRRHLPTPATTSHDMMVRNATISCRQVVAVGRSVA